jgi:mitogen-activated protein kinase kinase kinase 11
MLLYELIVGQRIFPPDLSEQFIAYRAVMEKWRPDIPDWIEPTVAELIAECWAEDPDHRPGFWEILERLEAMDFEVVPGVNSTKMAKFVAEMKEQE